ncbi:hypothetical protein LTR70_006384 [Exophiala xenobiotica]|nr:hypothetical protein LTR70_006384 [Exophiala xenobiotica]
MNESLSEDLRKDLCRRSEPLLSRTHTLDIDISSISRFQDIDDIDDIGSSAFATALPQVQALVIRDAFTCTNTTSLLARYPDANHPYSSDGESEAQSTYLKDLVREVVEKRMGLTQGGWIAIAVTEWFDRKGAQRYWGPLRFVFRVRIEGLTAGTYEVAYQSDKSEELIGDIRRLDASDLDEGWWKNGVEEVDFEAEVRDHCLMM